MIILLYPAACIYSSILFSFFKFKKKEKKKRKRIRRNTFSHIENSKNERFHSILEKKKKKKSFARYKREKSKIFEREVTTKYSLRSTDRE